MEHLWRHHCNIKYMKSCTQLLVLFRFLFWRKCFGPNSVGPKTVLTWRPWKPEFKGGKVIIYRANWVKLNHLFDSSQHWQYNRVSLWSFCRGDTSPGDNGELIRERQLVSNQTQCVRLLTGSSSRGLSALTLSRRGGGGDWGGCQDPLLQLAVKLKAFLKKVSRRLMTASGSKL